MELVDFTRARLDEEAVLAQAATPGPWRHDEAKHWRKPGTSWFEEAVFAGPTGKEATCVAGTGETDDQQSMRDAAHIARHDPARVLREVESTRQLVEWHEPSDDGESCSTCLLSDSDIFGQQFADFPCTQLRVIVTRWSDHPEYRAGWRP